MTREWIWTTRVSDMRTGRQILQAPEDYGTSFSPDDQALAAHQRGEGLGLGLSEVADRRAFRELVRDPSDGPSTYRDCAFSPTLPVLAAAMGDGFGFWDVRTGNQVARQVWPRGSAGVWFERSGALLVHGHGGLTRWPARGVAPGVWRFGPPEPLAPPVTSSRGAGDFAASLDGSVVVRGDVPASTVWRRDRPVAPVALSPHREVRHVEVSPDGRWVTTMGIGTEHVKVWDAGTGRLAREFSEATGPPQFSPDGRWLAAYDGRLRFWEVGTWRPITPGARDIAEGSRAVTFSPDGRLVALAGNDVRLLDPTTGHGVARLEGPARDQYRSLAFSPDGTMLAGAADYQSIHIWDLRAVRRELSAIGLDWDLPPYPPAMEIGSGEVKIEIDPGQTATAAGL